MGVDICLAVEYKEEGNYFLFGVFDGILRNSDFFSDLAGVRSPCPPKYDLRGFPSDISRELLDYYSFHSKGRNVHTEGWLKKPEFKKVCKPHRIFLLRAIIKAMSELPKPRVIFWFDD